MNNEQSIPICEIVVYDYNKNPPEKLKVNAICVGGKTGVFAVFQYPKNPKWLGIASGDDDHWWLLKTYSKYWNSYMIRALNTIESKHHEENVIINTWKPYCYETRCKSYSKEDKIKPNHGSCCTCQICGYPYDECICQFFEEPCLSCSYKEQTT